MEPMEATLFRVTVGWLDFGIDIFQLVIRLVKGKQMAFRLSALLWCPAAPAVLCEPLEPSFLRVGSRAEQPETPFLTTAAPAFEVKHDHEWCCRQAHAFQVWSSFFWWFFWGQTYCASNSLELVQPLNAFGHDLTTFPKGSNARPLG